MTHSLCIAPAPAPAPRALGGRLPRRLTMVSVGTGLPGHFRHRRRPERKYLSRDARRQGCGGGAPPQPCVAFRRPRPRPESRGTNMSAPSSCGHLGGPAGSRAAPCWTHPPKPQPLSSSSSERAKKWNPESSAEGGAPHPALAPRAHRRSCSELRLRLQQHAPLIAFSCVGFCKLHSFGCWIQ